MNTPLLAKDLMETRLVTLSLGMDIYDAIAVLLKHRISGAPVVDTTRRSPSEVIQK